MRRRDFIKPRPARNALHQAPAVTLKARGPQPSRTVKIMCRGRREANDALGRLVAQRIQEKFGVNTVGKSYRRVGLIGTHAVTRPIMRIYELLARPQHRRDALVLKGREVAIRRLNLRHGATRDEIATACLIYIRPSRPPRGRHCRR